MQLYQRIHLVHPEWQLDMYGSGELQEKLTEEVRRLDANIYLNNQTQNIFEKYLESSILVLTSYYEPFGLVMPEAMSCGLPVVAFDCPYGPADIIIITDKKDGFLVKSRDIDLYVKRLSELMDSSDLRCKMGHNARMSSQRFMGNNIMPQWEQLFRELLEKSRNE